MTQGITAAVRWAARITGALLVGLFVLIAIGEGGPPNILGRPVPVQLESAGMLMMLVGFLVGWRWEAVGGVLAIAGFGTFLVTEMVVNGKPPGGAIPLFLIPGVLFLISFGLRKALRIPGSARPE